jgi:homoserine dehydrogenase
VDVSKVVRIGLLGYGTVGSAVYALVQQERARILQSTGVDLQIVRIVDKDRGRFGRGAPAELFTETADAVLGDPSISVVVELIGGTGAAYDLVEGALKAGKDVVTANKQLLAGRGQPLFELARDLGRQIRFEASVAGAVPIIKVLRESMAGADLHTVYGIVNGTTNYILSQMFDCAGEYPAILARAQELGYAEADPTDDVGGGDAAAKMAILGSIAFHSRVTKADVHQEGITGVGLDDVQYAKGFGFAVKLIGAARLVDGRVNVRVYPALVPLDHPLAAINGAYNAVFLQGNVIDQIVLSGPGAGGRQTSSAVLADIIAIAGTEKAGFLQNCSCYLDLPFCPDEEMESAFFIRVRVEDRAGVLAQIASVFGAHGVSIESLTQRGHADQAELVLITHPGRERKFFAAITEVGALSCVRSRPMTLRVL